MERFVATQDLHDPPALTGTSAAESRHRIERRSAQLRREVNRLLGVLGSAPTPASLGVSTPTDKRRDLCKSFPLRSHFTSSHLMGIYS